MIRLTTLKVNQVIVHEPHRSTFFSYDTPIASKYEDGRVVCYSAWNYSATTGKYRNEFLGEGIAATRHKLDISEYEYQEDYYAKD